LTKRPERMYQWFEYSRITGSQILPNLWLGVSVEDQVSADERIPWLLKTPAAVRFVSYEPALGPVDFTASKIGLMDLGWKADYLTGYHYLPGMADYQAGCGKLDWIITGGESGPGARQAHPDWFRSVRDQCQKAGIPFFLKQMMVEGKLVHMPELDGKIWDQFPEVK
jgi:protein gp37